MRTKVAALRQTILSQPTDAPCHSPPPDAPSSLDGDTTASNSMKGVQSALLVGVKDDSGNDIVDTVMKKKKTSPQHSLECTSVSEDDENDPDAITGPKEPPLSPMPCSTILESTLLVASPISNLTTDLRAFRSDRNHPAAPEDASTRAIANTTSRSPPPSGASTRNAETTTTIPTMRLVESVALQDPYGDTGLYTGVVARGRPESHGTMHYRDGRTYTGSWKRGRWHGYGKAVFANGDSYMGEYEADVRNGIGRYEWADGRVYDGRFSNDQREGAGTYSWPDGSVYAGKFRRGLRHGQGTFTFADGSVYSGEWVNGKQHGTGECVWKDGRCYRGEWAKGRAHGFGVEVRPDGSLRHEGEWHCDRPVRSSKTKHTKDSRGEQ